MKTGFEKKSKLVIADFFFFKLVKVVSEEEKVLVRRLCFKCEVLENFIIAGNWLVFYDGRCFKIKQKCYLSGMFIVVEHRELPTENAEDRGNISYFRVFDYSGSEIFARKRYSTRFSDMEMDIFCEDLVFRGNYFEFQVGASYGALSLDGEVIVPPEYVVIYQQYDRRANDDLLYCYTGGSVDGEDECHVYSLLGKKLSDY